MNPDPTIRATFWSVCIGDVFLYISGVGINPASVQRFQAVSSLKDAKRTLIIFVGLTIVTKTINFLSGLIIYAKYFDCDPFSVGLIKKPDQILPYYVLDVANNIPGLTALFIAGLFTTAFSTLSTYLNVISGIIYTDFVVNFMPTTTSEKTASDITKIIAVIVGIVTVAMIFVVERLGMIFEILFSVDGITSGMPIAFFGMGMVFPFANTKGVLTGGIVSFSFMVWLIFETRARTSSSGRNDPTRPLYTYACNITSETRYSNDSVILATTAEEQPFWLFRLSFHYYIMIGCLVCLFVGLPVSWFTRNSQKVRKELLAPSVRQLTSKSKKQSRAEEEVLTRVNLEESNRNNFN